MCGTFGIKCYPCTLACAIVADGAALDLGGTNQYFQCVSGAGVVSNGTLVVSKLVADPLVGPFTLDGTLLLEAPPVVEIRNFSPSDGPSILPIASCGAFEGAEFLRAATFTGDRSWEGLYRARLVYRNGTLAVEFRPRGMILVVE